MTISSKVLPATCMEEEIATPLREITAISVVPPPTSTTKVPCGWEISTPAPIAAATGSSIRQILPHTGGTDGIDHGTLFHFRDLTGDADHHTGHKHLGLPLIFFEIMMRSPILRQIKVRNHTVTQRTHHCCALRSPANHFVGFFCLPPITAIRMPYPQR